MVVRTRTGKRRKAMLKAATIAALWLAMPEGAAEAGQVFNYTGSVQNWVVPTTGQYQIVASGAGGGTNGAGQVGGKGAQIGGFLSLTAGDTLGIYVGGAGGNPNVGSYGGGGGGGSFVYNVTSTTLLMAAGGGGGAYASTGGDGQVTQGPSPGNGGSGSQRFGGGGAGWLTAGGHATGGGKPFPSLAGGTGTYAGSVTAVGGFGGGGGGGGYGGGGGGGWSGGDAGSLTGAAGAGGFSLNTGTDQTNVAGFQAGNGVVEITPFTAPVPEPGAAMLMASGFAAMAAGTAWSRRRRLGL